MFWTDHTRILHIQRLLYIIGTMLARQTSHANQRSFWNGRKREAGQGETCPLPKEPYWTLTPFFVSKIVGFMMLNVPYYHNLPYKVQKFSLFYILLGSPRPLTKTQMHKFYGQMNHVYHYNVQAMGKNLRRRKKTFHNPNPLQNCSFQECGTYLLQWRNKMVNNGSEVRWECKTGPVRA